MDRFEFLSIDIVDKHALESLKDCHIDAIYHLACPASPIHYQKIQSIRLWCLSKEL